MGNADDGLIRIWVDDREARQSTIAERLAAMPDVVVSVKRLRTGDYLIEGKAVMERKRVPDFLDSMGSGRLFAQASRLAAAPMPAFLILEGRPEEWRSAGVTREGIQGALVALSVGFGIPVLRAQDELESAKLITYAARRLSHSTATAMRRPARRLRGKRARQVHILTGIPGIGAHRAQRLLDRFESVAGVASASPEALTEVEGIGTKTAQRIHWAVHESITPYLS